MSSTLLKYVPLQFYSRLCIDPPLLHISIKSLNSKLYLPYYWKCDTNKYATQMPQIRHMHKLLNVHLWEKHATMPATYEVTPLNNVARIIVHR